MGTKKLFRSCILGLLLLFVLAGCESEENKTDKVEFVNLKVAAETVTITSPLDLIESDWLVVNEKNNSYYLPLNWIKNFEYEAGFEYELQVKKVTPANPIQDAPQSFYYLIRVLSKVEVE